MHFSEAEAECQGVDGRHLVSIHDKKNENGQTENEFVLQIAKDAGFNGTLWIGFWFDATANNASKCVHSNKNKKVLEPTVRKRQSV